MPGVPPVPPGGPVTPPLPPHVFVEDPSALASLAEALRGVPVLGLDTESDSMHSYFEKVCLLQVVLPGDRIFVVDTIQVRDLSSLKPFLEDPAVRKVLHGADYDLVCMKRDFGIAMRGTFCTMTAGLLLGLPKIGLADLVESQFGVRLAKAFTKSDWSARPLSAGQREYLVQDVQFLIPLAEEMDRRLRAADLVEEASIEFGRLEARLPAPKEFDPWGFLRVKGARALDERGRSVLRALVALREEKSREADRPPFKVLANETLLKLAEVKPDSEGRLRGVRGVTPYILKRYGEEILAAVKRGREDPSTVPDRAPPGDAADPERRMSFADQKRHGRLKEWRAARSGKTGLTTLAILPNPAMFAVARLVPRDVAALAAVEGVGAHRARAHGEEMLRALHGRRGAGGSDSIPAAAAPAPPGEEPRSAPAAAPGPAAAPPRPAPRPAPAPEERFGPPPLGE
jgi:ribonuclease D